MTQQIKKIVIIGPESTGKSTLTELLAQHYHTEWCKEYAREYLLANGTDYSYNDLLTIAKGQVALEASGIESRESKVKQLEVAQKTSDSRFPIPDASPLLFIDTDMHVMKVWCEFVFGKCHPYIKEQIAERKYDLYLLCNIDLPWVKDELREYPDEAPRIELYAIYKNILQNQSVPWVDISGNYEERLQKAIEAVDRMV